MTYSVLLRDPGTGELGVAVQSHFFAVGSQVPWVEAGVGAVATQAVVNLEYGRGGLAAMRQGLSAAEALAKIRADDPLTDLRQVAMLDAQGGIAVHTGPGCIGAVGSRQGENWCVQGNLLDGDAVLDAMADAAQSGGNLADRLLAVLEAGHDAGGDVRGAQAAALIVAGQVDLRVDDSPHPVAELRRLLARSRAAARMMAAIATPGAVLGEPGDSADAALKALAEAREGLGPANAEPDLWRGVVLARDGRAEAARTAFAEAIAVHPPIARLLPRLAEAGILGGHPEKE
ncbi:DUF1028 domain-containing protein [Amycolatopsis jejuensis]|uniref:DUF1028 domain-containing protein n=1 Tax=Amycolatopsis jejuensis TaxID=330084 RepID=UPI000527E6E7|nr:DUF1028 domain-containing protein [Amycolatopsis jejuensis]